MTVFLCVLFLFLILCAIAVSFSKNLLNSILIFMSYSLVMSIIWVILESPDLAITEAAVGAGVTTVLFLITLKKIHAIMNMAKNEHDEKISHLDAGEDAISKEKIVEEMEKKLLAEQDASEEGDLL